MFRVNSAPYMLTLVKRTNAANFRGNFAGDFESPMCAGSEGGVGAQLQPSVTIMRRRCRRRYGVC